MKQAKINFEGKIITLRIIVPMNEAGAREVSKMYYKEADGVIFLYDIQKKNSFTQLKISIRKVMNDYPSKPRILIGNTNDDFPNIIITSEEGKKLADEFIMPFFETSTKTKQNINEAFNFLLHEIQKKAKEEEKPKACTCF